MEMVNNINQGHRDRKLSENMLYSIQCTVYIVYSVYSVRQLAEVTRRNVKDSQHFLSSPSGLHNFICS